MNSDPLPKLPWNIYWINLDRRPDRKAHMEKLLENNSDNSFRIQAIDCENNFYPYNIIKNKALNGGEHGCVSSHIKALAYFLENSEDEYCFISEDDVLNSYSIFWKEYHYELIHNKDLDIIQMQTTTDFYNDNNLKEIHIKVSTSGACFYRIKRAIAEKIIANHYDTSSNTIHLSNHINPVADNLIWHYGNVYLIPMISYIDAKDSETTKENKNMNTYWINYFQNAKNKYLNYWKSLK